MANLQETSDFTPGIYQIETADPVQGGPNGVTNVPIKALTNRTRWLKDQQDSLAKTLGDKADKASPGFTGTPTAPTPARGAEGTRLATTAYALAASHGLVYRDVTNDPSSQALTADETSGKLLAFVGTNNLPARYYAIPPGKHRVLVVEHRASGAGPIFIVVLGSGEPGVRIEPGRGAIVWTDGATCFRGVTDLTDSYLIRPRASTPAPGAVSDEVVTAGWVRNAIAASSGFVTGDLKVTLRNDVVPGWILHVENTFIGNPTSGANNRASEDTRALYYALWGWWSNDLCPVNGGRGASAQADFDASKSIRLPPLASRTVGIAGWGFGLSNRPFGTIIGAEAHTLSWNEMPPHVHGMDGAGYHGHVAWTDNQGAHAHTTYLNRDRAQGMMDNAVYGDENFYGVDGVPTDVQGTHSHNVGIQADGFHAHAIQNAGAGSPHNNMQPTIFLNWLIKL